MWSRNKHWPQGHWVWALTSIFAFFYIVRKCAETWILCESKKVNRLRREIHLPPVSLWFLWWTITQRRRAVIVQEEAGSQLWISADFYYILLASVAAQGFLSVADIGTQGIYLFISLSYTRQKQDEMRGRTLMNLRVANSAWCLAHIHVWVIAYSFCVVTRKHMHTHSKDIQL